LETSEYPLTNPDFEADEQEIARLRRAYQAMHKVHGHGDETFERHPDIRPEWIMKIIEEPYDQFEVHRYGRRRTVITGRVPQLRQWISVVFDGDPETGQFLTAYQDSRMEKMYGGRPWQSN
jgi:hypothetical protein